jgi:hypothetical protein
MSAKFTSSDFLPGTGLAAIENNDEAKKIIEKIDNYDDLLANLEAQVLVKAHSDENMKASEEFVDSLNLEKAASVLDCRINEDNAMAKLKKSADFEENSNEQRCLARISDVHKDVQSLKDILTSINEIITSGELSSNVILGDFRRLYRSLKDTSESLEISMEDVMKIADLFDQTDK